MKNKLRVLLVLLAFSLSVPMSSRAQSVEDCIEQLVLDYQKLAGLKDVLAQMYSGYELLSKGYGAVKNVSQGNFSLHEAFLDGLLLVSPAVRKYPRVADIISDQATLFSEYQNALRSFRSGGRFSPEEISYMVAVYDNLAGGSLQNLDDLLMVMSDSKLRMSDAERLAAIDRIFLDSRSKLSYLRKFNNQARQTALIRGRAASEKQTLNGLYGLKP